MDGAADGVRLTTKYLIDAWSIGKCWVVLSALDVLDAVTAVVCYCDKTRPPALALNFNLVHKNYD
jgi:hypothetical protein